MEWDAAGPESVREFEAASTLRPREPGWMQRAARRIYTANPFYVISCALVLYGLIRSFQGPAITTHPWTLMSLLAGYTLLLAATAYVLIRWGKVWDDARTILLLIVLLLLGLSVSFDKLLDPSPGLGRNLLLTGLAVAALISEAILRGLKIRLPAGYRVPYYLLLALFFLYPLSLVGLRTSDTVAMSWRVLAFAVLAAALFLTLLPAVRRGAAYVQHNGTPWTWPLFPCSLFVFLAIAVGLRTWLLGISFVPALEYDSSFGLYFLAPLVLVLNLLLLEVSLAGRHSVALKVAMAMPLLCLAICCPRFGDDWVYAEFLGTVVSRVGSPTWLAIWAIAAFYGYGLWRKVPLANLGLTIALVLATAIGPETTSLDTLAERPIWFPAALAAMIQIARAIRLPTSWRVFVGGTLTVFLAWSLLANSPWESYAATASGHLWLVFVMLLGCVFDDEFARALRVCAMLALVILSLDAVRASKQSPEQVLDWMLVGYAFSLCLAALFAAWWLRSLGYLVTAALVLINNVLLLWRSAYFYLAATVVGPGLDWMLYGIAFFLLAAVLSSYKAGLLHWVARRMAGGENAA